MARIAIASGYGCSLAWAARLQDEGVDVKVWQQDRNLKRIGEGIVPLAGTFEELYWFVKEGNMSREPSMMFFDASGMGEKADRVRKYGIAVAGGGEFCDKLEKDRLFGFNLAEEAGCQLPPHKQYGSLTESEQDSPEGEFYFKTDRYLEADATKGLQDAEHQKEYFQGIRERYGDKIKHILQTKIEGVPLSTARWWNGHDWTGPYEGTYEHKAFMDGDLGGSTGCSFNAVFFYRNDPPIAEELGWENLTQLFRKNDAPPGLYDINAVVTEDGEVYFLEWTPRLGYDSEMTSFRLMPSLADHLFNVANGREMPVPKGELAYSIRLSIPPYPWEYGELREKGTADGKLVRGVDGLWDKQFIGYQLRQDPKTGLVLAGPEGIVGLSLAVGDELSILHDTAFEYAKGLHKRGISALQFRSDGQTCIKEDAEKIQDAGHDIHEGMVK